MLRFMPASNTKISKPPMPTWCESVTVPVMWPPTGRVVSTPDVVAPAATTMSLAESKSSVETFS